MHVAILSNRNLSGILVYLDFVFNFQREGDLNRRRVLVTSHFPLLRHAR